MYSIDNEDSFNTIKDIREKMTTLKPTRCPCVVVGNKSDLKHLRKVPCNDGQTFAEEHGAPFFEVSAADNITEVQEVFAEIHRLTKSLRYNRKKTLTNSNMIDMVSKLFQKKERKMKNI